MIEFIEGEPFVSSGAFTPTRQTLVPVRMIKDGIEYFVSNLPIAGGNYSPEHHRKDLDGYKEQLLRTGGQYFKFHGLYDDPEDMIAEMQERGHSFVDPGGLFLESLPQGYGAGFTDFRGNRNEVSAAFHYRVFDRAYAEKLRELVKPVTGKKGKKRRGRTTPA